MPKSKIPVNMVILTALVTGLIFAALVGKVTAPVNVAGRITVENNRHVVQHPFGGTISTIYVEDNDYVEEGQVLFTVNTSLESDLLDLAESRLLENLRIQSDSRNIITNIANIELVGGAQDPQSALVQTLAADPNSRGHTTIAFLDGQKQAQEVLSGNLVNRIEFLEELLEVQLDLVEHLAQVDSRAERLLGLGRTTFSERNEAFSRLSDAQNQANATQQNILALHQQVLELDRDLLSLFFQTRQREEDRLAEALREETLLRQELIRLNSIIQQRELKAPVSGYIMGISQFNTSSVINPNTNLGFIIPVSNERLVSAQLPADEIRNLSIGQTASVNFISPNSQEMIDLDALVAGISADTVQTHEGIPPHYVIKITFRHDDEIVAQLPVGMPVQITIPTTTLSVWNYVTRPIIELMTSTAAN